jgi:hypothetical protein
LFPDEFGVRFFGFHVWGPMRGWRNGQKKRKRRNTEIADIGAQRAQRNENAGRMPPRGGKPALQNDTNKGEGDAPACAGRLKRAPKNKKAPT